jgi:hypothetical protein
MDHPDAIETPSGFAGIFHRFSPKAAPERGRSAN